MTDLATIGFRAETGDLDVASKKLKKLASDGGSAEKKINRSVKSVNSSFLDLRNTVGLVGASLAALGSARLVQEAISYSESWKAVNNTLRIVVDSEKELINVRTRLLRISNETNANLESTASLYAEMYRNTQQLGVSQGTVLTVTQTLNNLFKAGAKDAATQAGAIRQLSQALGAGALRGDEFNSVAEAAPRVLDALSQSLGMAKGELRDFAATGGITAGILIEALQSYSDEAQQLADKTVLSWEQSTTVASNNLSEFLGETNLLTGAIGELGETVIYLSENLEPLENALLSVVGVVGLAMTPAIYKYSASLISAAQAQLLAGTTATKTVNAFGMVTTTAASATVATNALAIATRFLLGPWGLLITAVGVGATAFSLSASNSDDLAASLKNQKDQAEDLTETLKFMNQQQIADLAIKSQFELIDAKENLFKAELKLQNLMFDPSAQVFQNKAAAKEVEEYRTQVQELEGILKKINELRFGSGAGAGDSTSAFAKQIQALKNLETQLGLTADESMVFGEVQKSIARGDTPEQTAAIEAQTRAYIKAKNAQIDFQNMISGQDSIEQKLLDESNAYDKWVESVNNSKTQLELLQEEIEETQKAMDAGIINNDAGLSHIEKLKDSIADINSQKITVFDQIGDSTKDALGSIQDLYAQGSKEYQKLGIAIQAVSAAQAVYAVLNQASGDPYSAFPRMAAMVAAVGALGFSVANINGGFADDSAEAQANQGLTVWGDKSESIADAIELTQDATSKLVGINTNMLSALQSMAQNLSNASALIARDSGGASFANNVSLFNGNEILGSAFTGLLGDVGTVLTGGLSKLGEIAGNIGAKLDIFGIAGAIGGLLGGSSKVTDSGIKIIGDSITDMIDDITVQAFQDIKYKKWAGGSSKRKTQIQDISDAVGGQFSLVLESMLDSVVYGAQALGISDSAIQSRVNAFEIATQEISLKDLSANEQQAEIEAVFSKIFDDLAVAVVPFAVDFQQVGEGLGETMSRLAVQMQVTQAASDQLGFSFGNASAEMNAFVSNELSAMVGGVSELASLTSSFVDNFASDEKKLEINTNALNQAMSGVGLGIPATAEGFFNLMGTLDATTEAGRAQIAAMLQIQDVASDYYSLLEDAENDRLAAIQATNNEFNSLTINLRSMIVSMYGLSEAAQSITLDMALAAAKQGNFELAKQFGGVDIQQSDYGSFAEFALAQAVSANKIEELAMLTEGQVSVDERQLNVLEEINKNIISSYNPSALTSGNNTQVNAVVKQQQQDIEQMKYAQQTMAKNAAQTAKILQRIEGFGIDVRVIQ